jgi:hypothetical protein
MKDTGSMEYTEDMKRFSSERTKALLVDGVVGTAQVSQLNCLSWWGVQRSLEAQKWKKRFSFTGCSCAYESSFCAGCCEGNRRNGRVLGFYSKWPLAHGP